MSALEIAALRLLEVLERENAALGAMDLTAVSAGVETKRAALEQLARTGPITGLDAVTLTRLDTPAG